MAVSAAVDLSTWIEKAIRDRSALLAYEEWRSSWSQEDQDIEAAFEAADRQRNPPDEQGDGGGVRHRQPAGRVVLVSASRYNPGRGTFAVIRQPPEPLLRAVSP